MESYLGRRTIGWGHIVKDLDAEEVKKVYNKRGCPYHFSCTSSTRSMIDSIHETQPYCAWLWRQEGTAFWGSQPRTGSPCSCPVTPGTTCTRRRRSTTATTTRTRMPRRKRARTSKARTKSTRPKSTRTGSKSSHLGAKRSSPSTRRGGDYTAQATFHPQDDDPEYATARIVL